MAAVASECIEREGASESGGIASFDALYAEHCDFVWRSLRRMGVQTAAVEDAMQDKASGRRSASRRWRITKVRKGLLPARARDADRRAAWAARRWRHARELVGRGAAAEPCRDRAPPWRRRARPQHLAGAPHTLSSRHVARGANGARSARSLHARARRQARRAQPPRALPALAIERACSPQVCARAVTVKARRGRAG